SRSCGEGRSACLCLAHPLYHRRHAGVLFTGLLAASDGRSWRAAATTDRSRGSESTYARHVAVVRESVAVKVIFGDLLAVLPLKKMMLPPASYWHFLYDALNWSWGNECRSSVRF